MKSPCFRTALPLALLAPLASQAGNITVDNPNLTTNAISTVYTDAPGDPTSVTKTGQGYVAFTSTTSNYSGGLFINAGGVRIGDSAQPSAFGSGTITIGSSVGGTGSAATLNLGDARAAYTLANNIVLGSDTAALTIGARGVNIYRLSGTVTGANDFRIAPSIQSPGTAGLNVIFEGQVNNTGFIINRSEMLQTSGSAVAVLSDLNTLKTAAIRGGIGSNVKGIIQENTNSAASLTVERDGTNAAGDIINIGSSGFIVRNTGGGGINISAGIGGTGDLTLQNNSTNGTTGLVIGTNNVVHAGKIINSGTGSGAASISALIGQGITEIRQDSATSALNISGNINVGTTTKTIRNTGGAAINLTSTAVGNGNSAIVFANDSAVNDAITVSGSGTVRPGTGIENVGSGTGSVLIGTSIVDGSTTGTPATLTQASATSALRLTAVNTYTGATFVNAGTLEVSGLGSINTTSRLEVASGATFRNTSSVAFSRALTVSEGALFTGTTGAFAPISLTINGDLADGFTALDFVSAFTEAGALSVSLTNIAAGSYTLIGSATTGAFTSVSVAGTSLSSSDAFASFTGANAEWNFAFNNATNQLSITAAAIPEPASAAALLGLGALAFGVSRRRRRA
ncbi:MAG: PEP-CTERM sorting domain-containing protein [Opitutaceae bacterium]|nr:PEP-CTERM sorting domain-containing protein [Opitutaceae bacterium]